MDRIVVGFDGSDHARKALARAADIANGATVAVVSAAHVEGFLGGAVSPIDPVEAEARTKTLAEAREYLEGRGVKGEYIEGNGNPADVLVDEAKEVRRRPDRDRHAWTQRGEAAGAGLGEHQRVAHATVDVLVVR